jgi:hypothetical protein
MPEIASPTEPVIGKLYSVPCVVLARGLSAVRKAGSMVPVMGPLHEDAKYFAVKDHHYHLDFRFIEARQWRELNDLFRLPMTVVVTQDQVARVAVVRMKCKRAMPTFPEAPRPEPMVRFESDYVDKAMCPKAMICPHRGLCLKGLPVVDGAVTCPGHGLRWNVETGAMVPRYLEKEA